MLVQRLACLGLILLFAAACSGGALPTPAPPPTPAATSSAAGIPNPPENSRAYRDADTAGSCYAASLADATCRAACRCGGYGRTRGPP